MKKTWRKALSWLLVLAISISGFNVKAFAKSGYDHDNSAENDNMFSENVTVGECQITFELDDQWDGGYKAEVRLTNGGSETIHNWCVEIEWDGEIADIWNAFVIKNEDVSEKSICIKNAGWNQDIEPGCTVSFGFRGDGTFSGFPQKYVIWSGDRQVSEENYRFEYKISASWDNALTAEISISNLHVATLIEDWILEFDYNGFIYDIWNGKGLHGI